MAGAEAANPKKVQIPGSDYFIVDADGDGIFNPPPDNEAVDTDHDYYAEATPPFWGFERDPHPVYSHTSLLRKSLANIGIPGLWKASTSHLNAIFHLCALLYGSDKSLYPGAIAQLSAYANTDPNIYRIFLHIFSDPRQSDDLHNKAALALGKLGNPEARPYLTKALEAKKGYDRAVIAEALAAISNRQIENERRPVREAIARMDPSTMLKTFEDYQQSEYVHSQAALTLSKFKYPELPAALIKVLKAKKEGYDRVLLVEVLGTMADFSTFRELGDVYKSETNPLVREKIVLVATGILQTGETEEARRAATYFFRTAEDKSLIPLLTQALFAEKDEDVCYDIVSALSGMLDESDKNILPVLSKAFIHEKAVNVREEIARATHKIDGDYSTIVQILRTGKNEVSRIHAAEALGAMNDRSLAPVLLAAYQEERSKAVCKQIEQALSYLSFKIVESKASEEEKGEPLVLVDQSTTPPPAKQVPAPVAAPAPEKVAVAIKEPTLTLPEQIAKYEALAQAAEKSKQPEEAILYYEQLTKLDPQNANYLFKLAQLYAQSGKYDQAVASCEKSIELCEDCDGLAAKRLLPKLEKEKKFFDKYSKPIPFIGFSTTDPDFDDGILSTFVDSFLREIKKTKLEIPLPNISEITANLRIPASCTEAECTAEIVGAMGLAAGFYGTIDWIPATKKYRFTLNYVTQTNAAIAHRVTVNASKNEIKNAFQLNHIANQLAQKMLKELKG